MHEASATWATATPAWLQAAQRVGLAGLMGLILLSVAAWVHWSWLPAQRAEVDHMASQARRTRHELLAAATQADQRTTTAGPAVIASPEQAWRTLWASLPTAEQRVALQAQVLDKARAQGLNINSVQYQGSRQNWAGQGTEALWRHRMVMPVDGRHAAVRAWLADMLAEPALSIDSVELQRSDVMSDQVKARVSISLWWRTQDKAVAEPKPEARP